MRHMMCIKLLNFTSSMNSLASQWWSFTADLRPAASLLTGFNVFVLNNHGGAAPSHPADQSNTEQVCVTLFCTETWFIELKPTLKSPFNHLTVRTEQNQTIFWSKSLSTQTNISRMKRADWRVITETTHSVCVCVCVCVSSYKQQRNEETHDSSLFSVYD